MADLYAEEAQIRCQEDDASVYELARRRVVHVAQNRVGVRGLGHVSTLLTSASASAMWSRTPRIRLIASSTAVSALDHAVGIEPLYRAKRSSAKAAHAVRTGARSSSRPLSLA